MHNIANPPIKWGLYLVYRRLPDGRIMYFRGQRRTKLYIRDFDVGTDGDWAWERAIARLFQHCPIISEKAFKKSLRCDPKVHEVHFCGYEGIVESTQLLLPEKKAR